MPEYLFQAIAWTQFGLLGVVGGIASYYYKRSTDPRFTAGMFVSKLVVSFFVGKVAGVFIADESVYKAGYVMLAGFFAYPVLAILEVRVKRWIENYSPRGPP